MSLEQKIAELAAAVAENTATLKAISGKVAETAKAPSKATEAAETKKAPARTTAKKPAAVEEDEDEKPKSKGGRPAKVKVLNKTEMSEKAREFCEAAQDDEDEFKARRAEVTKIAKKLGYDKFSDINEADDQAKALAALKAFLEDEEGDEDEDEEGEGY